MVAVAPLEMIEPVWREIDRLGEVAQASAAEAWIASVNVILPGHPGDLVSSIVDPHVLDVVEFKIRVFVEAVEGPARRMVARVEAERLTELDAALERLRAWHGELRRLLEERRRLLESYEDDPVVQAFLRAPIGEPDPPEVVAAMRMSEGMDLVPGEVVTAEIRRRAACESPGS